MKEAMMIRTGALLLLALFAGGCLNTTNVKAVEDADLASVRTFYVVERETDKQDIHIIVRDELRRWGKTATSGPRAAMPARTEVLVTTDDHWFWDMRMYLTELEVVFRDPQTKEVLASAIKKRGSLDAKSPAYMAWEAVAAVFVKTHPGEKPLPAPGDKDESEESSP